MCLPRFQAHLSRGRTIFLQNSFEFSHSETVLPRVRAGDSRTFLNLTVPSAKERGSPSGPPLYEELHSGGVVLALSTRYSAFAKIVHSCFFALRSLACARSRKSPLAARYPNVSCQDFRRVRSPTSDRNRQDFRLAFKRSNARKISVFVRATAGARARVCYMVLSNVIINKVIV